MATQYNLKSIVVIAVLLALIGNNTIMPLSHAGEISQALVLPPPGTMVGLSPYFKPPVLRGLKVHPGDPFRFEFILDKGSAVTGHPDTLAGGLDPDLQRWYQKQSPEEIKNESNKLIKYFLASLTVPEKDLWVNLSPYEKNRIVPDAFGRTEMGRDLLAQDYLLKQITASLVYPEGDIGKRFWKKVYEIASNKNATVNTFRDCCKIAISEK